MRLLAVVGSRACTTYGRNACEYLLKGLAGYPVVIVSGLALGMDAWAHEMALAHGLRTVAVPGSGLDDSAIAPQSNKKLADRILASGGALLSELEPTEKAAYWTFPRRNRIMAGMSDAVLVIEAGEKSGTLITAKLTVDYNRDLLVVPNSIFAENSKGALQFLKLGATPVTEPEDILKVLGIQTKTSEKTHTPLTQDEERVYVLLREPMPRDELIEKLGMPVTEANVLLSAMELKDLVYEKLGKMYRA
jgi:DNA processing protein